MAPFRLPFSSKKPVNGAVDPSDENVKPASPNPLRPSLALGTKEKRDEPNEFKLSSVGADGQYMPPSPTEKNHSLHKSPPSAASTGRGALAEAEPFSISRESFDSYRRSFDISGRSPIIHSDSYTSRTSLDSRRSGLPTRGSLSNDLYARPPAEKRYEEDFEDVKLLEESPHKPKKKSFLSRFGESADDASPTNGESKHHFSLIPGRRRGQSGTGSELKDVQRTDTGGNSDNVVR